MPCARIDKLSVETDDGWVSNDKEEMKQKALEHHRSLEGFCIAYNRLESLEPEDSSTPPEPRNTLPCNPLLSAALIVLRRGDFSKTEPTL